MSIALLSAGLAPVIWPDVLAASYLPDTAAVVGGLLIFLARVLDVSLGTIRTIYTMQGRRLVASVIGIFESAIFITAITGVLAGSSLDPSRLVGYVLGYATGIFVGISIENFIASGWNMLRIISRDNADLLTEHLREQGIAVTRVMGEGRDGPVPILFVVLRRKRAKPTLKLIRKEAPKAFVTVESVGRAMGGTVPMASAFAPFRMAVRK